MVNEELLKKIRSGKDLTEEEMESLPEGELKADLKKRKVINARIQQRVARQTEKGRAADAHRKILMGVAAEQECKTNPEFRKFFYELLDRFYQDDVKKREALGLPPRKEDLKKAPDKPKDGEPQVPQP